MLMFRSKWEFVAHRSKWEFVAHVAVINLTSIYCVVSSTFLYLHLIGFNVVRCKTGLGMRDFLHTVILNCTWEVLNNTCRKLHVQPIYFSTPNYLQIKKAVLVWKTGIHAFTSVQWRTVCCFINACFRQMFFLLVSAIAITTPQVIKAIESELLSSRTTKYRKEREWCI